MEKTLTTIQKDNDYLRTLYLERLRAARERGMSQREMSRTFNVSRNRIRKDLAELRAYDEIGTRAGNLLKRDAPPVPAPVSSKSGRKKNPFKGGMSTRVITKGQVGSIVSPPDEWRIEEVDPEELSTMAPAELISRLIRVSPEMARGLFDFLRMANPNHTINAYKYNTRDKHDVGQLAVEEFERQLARVNGSANVVYNRILTNIWLRGAFLAELVLDKSGRIPIQISVPDAGTVRFRIADSPEYGLRWEAVQRQEGEWVSIERETVKWAAFDPLPETPYGTAPVAPALFPAVFLLTLLQDARRVVAQQGWPRYDIAIDEEALLNMLGDSFDREDPELVKELFDSAVNEVSNAYDLLEPTSAYVHTAAITVNEPKGAFADLPFLKDLVSLLERQNVRSLKTMPILFGMTDNTSEANANRQWEIHASSVRAMQDLAETNLSDIFTLALQAQGIDAYAVFEFDELRSAEEMRDAETLEVKLRNARELLAMKFETPTQVAVRTVGHELPEGVTDEDVEEALASTEAVGQDPRKGGANDSNPDEGNPDTGETGSGSE